MLLTKEQKNCEAIQNQLVNLWCEVFNDSEDYVRLYMPYLSDFEVYGVFEDEKIVSCFYLLPSEIICKGKAYKGYYLYAAATKAECRGKGYMGRLIKEAVSVLEEKTDFISLVPADEGLYSYYSRFGFKEAMYSFVTELDCKGNGITGGMAMGAKEVNRLRKESLDNAHFFTDRTMEYALQCYGFFGSEFFKKDNNAFLYVKDENTVYETLSSGEDEQLSFLESGFKGRIKAVSPCRLTEKSEKIKCGMVKAFSEALKNEKEIYMNHTLM